MVEGSGSLGSGSLVEDYIAVVGHVLEFATGQERVCHQVIIIDDASCELPHEYFISILEYQSGRQPINITKPRTSVLIEDILEPECGKNIKN